MKENIENEKLMTVKETAEYLRTTPATIYIYICNGKLPSTLFTRFGSKILFRKNKLDGMLFTPEPVKNLDLIYESICDSLNSFK